MCLYSIDLERWGNYLENARQLFLLQYYTALRVSDLVEVDVIEVFEEAGRKLAILYNRKTDSKITIPVADKSILEILEGVIYCKTPNVLNWKWNS